MFKTLTFFNSSSSAWTPGQSCDSAEDQSLALWSGQRRRDWKPHRPPAEGNPGSEFCQLLRLLREVGAAGASASTVQRDGAEQEVQ